MIAKIWVQIVFIIAVTVVPAMMLETRMLNESINLIFGIIDRSNIRELGAEHLSRLKEMAKRDPKHAHEYKAAFDRTAGSRQAIEEFYLVRDAVRLDLSNQTLRNMLIGIGLSLVLALIVSRRIVAAFRKLLLEREAQTRKLAEFSALESSQQIARMLVHELRAPITPIKLVATDIETKFQVLSPEAFSSYLQQSQQLVREQVQQIEHMVTTFTRFGQLPAAQPKPFVPGPWLEEFVAQYRNAFGARVRLITPAPVLEGPFHGDPRLLRDLVLNLAKNAAEANSGSDLSITIIVRREGAFNQLDVVNDGIMIPADLATKIFEPYVSRHAGTSGRLNMGLGLTIAKKIAFDHGGDLSLIANADGHVAFRATWPESSTNFQKEPAHAATLDR